MEAKKTLTTIIMVVLIFIAPELARGSNESIEGTWQGVLKTPEVELTVVFKISRMPDGNLTATIDSPDQGSVGIPVDEATFENGKLYIESKRIQGIFTGNIKEDGLTIEGQWEQGGGRLPLIVKRVNKTTVKLQTQITGNQERARDGIIHIEKELVRDIPQVPRLCDQMDIVKRRVNVSDCNLYCEVEGEGVPMVLLHGGPGATHHYFHPSFSQAKDFAKIIYYDQRGCGISDYIKGKGYSIDQAVDDLENLRKSLNINKWVVLGWSYGGVLGQSYAVKYPESLSGLILVCSDMAMPVVMKSTRQYEFISIEEREKIKAIRSTSNLTLEQFLYNASLNGDWKRQCYYKPTSEEIARSALYGWKQDSNFNSIMSRDSKKVDLKAAFNDCPIPTIIMEGRWDLTWNTDKPGILHKNHPNANLHFFEESAHLPFEDEPEKFFDALQNFVLKLPKIASSDLQQWKEYLSKWEKEKAKQVKQKEEEKRKKDPFLTSEMTKAEAQAIEEFRKIRKNILTGQKYENTSTPLRVFLSYLSATHSRDVEAMKRLYALDVDKMGIKLTNEHFADVEQYFAKLDILRAPLSPEKPAEGAFWPIFLKSHNKTVRVDTLLFVFREDKWMYVGNNPALKGNWKTVLPDFKAALEKFGK
ncbi:alpha/beta fold hydrolase [Planctomycetota bacterium]